MTFLDCLQTLVLSSVITVICCLVSYAFWDWLIISSSATNKSKQLFKALYIPVWPRTVESQHGTPKVADGRDGVYTAIPVYYTCDGPVPADLDSLGPSHLAGA